MSCVEEMIEEVFAEMKYHRCKTCKWWPGSAGGNAEVCKHSKLRSGSQEVPRDGAMDGEAWGGILTGPDFGCIHHPDNYSPRGVTMPKQETKLDVAARKAMEALRSYHALASQDEGKQPRTIRWFATDTGVVCYSTNTEHNRKTVVELTEHSVLQIVGDRPTTITTIAVSGAEILMPPNRSPSMANVGESTGGA